MSAKLRVGDLKPVFHGAPEILMLKELVRDYNIYSTWVMLRINAIYRARANWHAGSVGVSGIAAEAMAGEARGGARVLAASLLTQLDALLERSGSRAAYGVASVTAVAVRDSLRAAHSQQRSHRFGFGFGTRNRPRSLHRDPLGGPKCGPSVEMFRSR